MTTTPPVVRLKKRKALPVWAGHPWIYSGAVAGVSGEAPPGSLVLVQDDGATPIGWGHLSPSGPITVRMLSLGAERPSEVGLLTARIDGAIARRRAVGLPTPTTDAFRLVHGEGDLLPGLVIDRLGDGVVIQLGTAAWARLADDVVRLLRERLKPAWGVVQVSPDAAAIEGLVARSEVAFGDEALAGSATVSEDGVRIAIDVLGGQKTGFYADQRETRRRVAELAGGRHVLDAFCHSGGFGLHALARGSAASVTFVDTSPRAIALVERGLALNGLSAEAVTADAMTYLKDAAAAPRHDLIVLDPPKLARSRAHLDDALRKYQRINEAALSALARDGLLVTCSCSGHVGMEELLRVLSAAAFSTRKHVHVIEERGQAPDHPFLAACPEGRYLKCVIAHVTDR